MKYELALKEKNVRIEDLSGKLQAKINALGRLIKRRNIAPKEEINDYDISIALMDLEIYKSIKKFNPEILKKRIAVANALNEKKGIPKVEQSGIEKEEEYGIEEQEEPYPDSIEQEQNDYLELDGVMSLSEEAKEKQSLIKSDLFLELRDKAYKAAELRDIQLDAKQYNEQSEMAESEESPEEIQDFQKAQPRRKMSRGKSWSFGLMTIGVLFFTWGAVNLARQSK
jgi:hypothetical protein